MSASQASTVDFASEGQLGFIRLANPDGVHVIGESFPDQLGAAVRNLTDSDEIRAVILSGGPRVFCAGADLSLVDRLREPEFGRMWLRAQHGALLALATLPKPTVAAVEGAAFGAGFNLALACDFVVASATARFCQAFVKVGLATDMGSPFLLTRRAGLQQARSLMYTGRTIDAVEALRLGMVDECVDVDAEGRAATFAAELASGPPLALAAMKEALLRAPAHNLAQVLDDELELQTQVLRSEDFREGANAFREKRTAQFQGN